MSNTVGDGFAFPTLSNDMNTWPRWHVTMIKDTPDWDPVTLRVKRITWEDSTYIITQTEGDAMRFLGHMASMMGDIIVWYDIALDPPKNQLAFHLPADLSGVEAAILQARKDRS